jgi:hypothetical protein
MSTSSLSNITSISETLAISEILTTWVERQADSDIARIHARSDCYLAELQVAEQRHARQVASLMQLGLKEYELIQSKLQLLSQQYHSLLAVASDETFPDTVRHTAMLSAIEACKSIKDTDIPSHISLLTPTLCKS